jgi:uncharacterized membrane protein YdjX (TVP38/TMEM64 family)
MADSRTTTAAGPTSDPDATAEPPVTAVPDTGVPSVLGRLTSPAFRVAILVLLVAVAVVLTLRWDGLDVAAVRGVVDGAGWLGPAVFVLLYAVAATALIPAAPFTIGAGLLFGPALGTAVALCGATAGATGAFGLGRFLGRDGVKRFGGQRVERVDAYVTARGFPAVLLIRLVPLFPFNLINLAAGVSGIRLWEYVTATAIGIIPGTVAYAALGGTIDDPTSPAFIGALLVFVVVTVAAGIAARRLRNRGALSSTP